jgi:hypothetical protein
MHCVSAHASSDAPFRCTVSHVYCYCIASLQNLGGDLTVYLTHHRNGVRSDGSESDGRLKSAAADCNPGATLAVSEAAAGLYSEQIRGLVSQVAQ